MSRIIPNFVTGEIYLLTSPSGQQYVGQTMTHRWSSSRQKWYKKGYMFRFQEHVKEAYSENKTQCWALNNAIKKYGADKFKVELIHECSVAEMDQFEKEFIEKYNTFNDGYNLNEGGWGGALHDSVYERISKTNHDKTDTKRNILIESIKDRITKVHFSDSVTSGPHSVLMDVYYNDTSVTWTFMNRNNDIFDSFLRSYYLIFDYVPDEKMSMSLGLIHYLMKCDGFEEFFEDFLPKREVKSETTAINTSLLQTRINRYKNLEIQHITLKLRKKGDMTVICSCIRSPSKNREIVSQFGGKGVSHQYALSMAEEFSHSLTTPDKISIRPELMSFIELQQLTLKNQLTITRKPRNVFNQ